VALNENSRSLTDYSCLWQRQ